jgi:copper chaperone
MIELNVPSMSCAHCVRSVTETVKKVDPAARVDVSLEQHRVTIESSRPVAEFAAALAEEGYAPA